MVNLLSVNKEVATVKTAKPHAQIEMEVIDSPLNRAHHYGRRADQLVMKGKYEEAIECHQEAAELLKEASSMTQSQQVRLSLELQRDRHLQQQRLIQMSCRQTQLKGELLVSSARPSSSVLGCKTAKDDKTRLEEQSTAIADLWRLVLVLLMDNKRLLEENKRLNAENVGLTMRRDPYEEMQSPSASQTQPVFLSLRLLEESPDLQQLMDTAEHS
ncbi:nuclear receptor binding factor 2a [Danio rerio]|uniref:Nuclear receptor binding factor 2a n=1 Tax=Danio rerio TaxID=7955 RepID=A0AB13AB16_DANRE|nr:nuclear receptor binding factor 2a [Danio rerio]|eukprot:XP_700277.2 nuclear receptor-binding factor 2-like [Danio rerio]